MPNFQPPPTWANPVLEEVDPATGKVKAGFNPVWLKWFIDLAAILSGTSGGGSGFSVLPTQIIFGSAAGFATSSERFTWTDDQKTLKISNEAEFGTITGGSFNDATRGSPGRIILSGSPNPGSGGGFVQVLGGAAGTDGGPGGAVEITAGIPQGSGNGGAVTISASGSGVAGGPGGSVVISSGAGDGGGNSGNVELVAAPVAGGGGDPGHIHLNGVVRRPTMLVADLPLAASSAGYTAIVTDAIAPTFLTMVTGGGTTTTPVFCDGAFWLCG